MRRRLMIYRGRYLTEVSFIRPYWPYLALRWNVSQTRKDAPVAPKPMQTHWEIPTIYMMTNTTNMASSPPAKMNRYCAFKPLYSTDRPMPLLIEYSDIRGRMSGGLWRLQSGRYRLRTMRRQSCLCRGRHSTIWSKP